MSAMMVKKYDFRYT